jgi:neutral ceramidase
MPLSHILRLTAVIAIIITIMGCNSSPGTGEGMRAGVARAVISNTTPRIMVNGRISEGIHSDIMARVLVLNDGRQRLVIVTSDLNCHDVITPVLRARIADELGMNPSQLILLVTHNHNAPIQINPQNFDYGHRVADTIFELIREAMANEQGPVTLKYGSGQGHFVASVGNAPVDAEVQVLKVMNGKKPMAIFFNHGIHPIQSTRNRIDTGHPGFAMDMVEKAFPGVQAMYATASGGNQFYYRYREMIRMIQEEQGRGEEYIDARLEEIARNLGSKLSEVVLDIVNGNMVDVTGPLSSRQSYISLPLAPPISEDEARKLLADVPDDIGFVPYPHEHRNTNWVRMLLRYYEKGLPFPATTGDMICTYDTYLIHYKDIELLKSYEYSIHESFPTIFSEVIVATIGTMPFVAMQGEVVAPIGARIKDTFRNEGPIMVSAYMGKHNLYIPTRELVRLDVYQPRTLQTQYASPVGWDPSVEDVMIESVTEVIRSSLNSLK